MPHLLAAVLALLHAFTASACPGCAGSLDNPKEAYTVFVLAGFIALTAIPFWLLYSIIIKHRKVNQDE